MSEPITPFGMFPSTPRVTGSSPLMPSCPSDLDITSLTSASGSQLNFWIDAANQAAGKKLLVKTGKVNDLWDRLAGYYGLNLSALSSILYYFDQVLEPLSAASIPVTSAYCVPAD
ncbi:hypothetical protein B0H10DRAFT_2221832 [Mycena sp. CBHHK59/15]|nr:hypothetical protein B0H10DRAFT_2221832 [Mycena sp. CBHHK59/15]